MYAREQEALFYIRERLPNQESCRAWFNFEFITVDNSINEVDLLVLSLYNMFLVDFMSGPKRRPQPNEHASASIRLSVDEDAIVKMLQT